MITEKFKISFLLTTLGITVTLALTACDKAPETAETTPTTATTKIPPSGDAGDTSNLNRTSDDPSSADFNLTDALAAAAQASPSSADIDSISQSLYAQMRSKIKINPSSSAAEVDTKSRAFIKAQYAPALIKNYAQIHAEMVEMQQSFSSCDDKKAFEKQPEIKQVLCIVQPSLEADNTVEVQYWTAYQDQPLERAASFVFTKHSNSPVLVMTDIRLTEKPGVEYYVPGV